MKELLEFLESIHPMSDELKEHLASILKEKKFPRKTFLLKAGQISRNIHFIQKGLIRCFYNIEGHEVCSWFMKEGDVIASVQSFYTQQPSYESIQVLEDAHSFYISYNELQHIYQHFPEFNYTGRVLTEKYYSLSEERLYTLRMHRSQERYQHLLNKQPDLLLRVPAKHLASYLGITEVTMSKIKGRA